jgi:hypothetical protein
VLLLALWLWGDAARRNLAIKADLVTLDIMVATEVKQQ